MSNIKDEIRKSLLILENKDISSDRKIDLKEHDLSDVAAEFDTKVEVLFKDNDEIEVEVYAKGGEELNRLMDLAGIFHKEKQTTGMPVVDMGSDLNMDPINTSSEFDEPAMDMGSDLNMDPINTSSEFDEPAMDVSQELDIPVENPLTQDMDFEMDEDRLTEFDSKLKSLIGRVITTKTGMTGNITGISGSRQGENDPTVFIKWESGQNATYPFSVIKNVMDEETNNSIDELLLGEGTAEFAKSGKKHDYGHPNPLLGKEPFQLDAHSFAGHGSKQVRYVPANSGDNAMDDPSHPKASSIRVKGLKEYIEEIETQKLNEKDSPETVIGAAKANIAQNLSPVTQKKIEDETNKLENKPGVANLDSQEIVADVASELAPREADALQKGYKAALSSGDIEEARYRYDYSFRNEVLPFQGLTGAQKVKRGAIRAAKSRIRKSPGIFGR